MLRANIGQRLGCLVAPRTLQGNKLSGLHHLRAGCLSYGTATHRSGEDSHTQGSGSQLVYSKGEGGAFTAEELQQYEEKGYLVVKGLIPQEDIEKYINRFKSISWGEVDSSNMLVMKDINVVKALKKAKAEGTGALDHVSKDNLIEKLQDWAQDEVLFEYCKHPNIMPYLKDIIGSAGAKAMHTMMINKPADVGAGSSIHPLHQDLWYFLFRPINNIVASWTALQKIDTVNGCLVVREGTHRQGELLHHGYPGGDISVSAFYHGIQDCRIDDTCVPLLMEPGDTVFFHPLLIHGSGFNKSTKARRAISTHYGGADCHYIDHKGTIQEEAVQEIWKNVQKRFPKGLEYNDLWRMKSRVVYGETPNL